MLLAGVMQCYVIEEWVHHSVHYYKSQGSVLQVHENTTSYHHTSPGSKRGYGLTSGFWDIPFRTRFPDHVRQRLYRGPKKSGSDGRQNPPAASISIHQRTSRDRRYGVGVAFISVISIARKKILVTLVFSSWPTMIARPSCLSPILCVKKQNRTLLRLFVGISSAAFVILDPAAAFMRSSE